MKHIILIVAAVAIGFAGAFVVLRLPSSSAGAVQIQPGYIQEAPFPPGFEQPHTLSQDEVDADWSRVAGQDFRTKYAAIKAGVQAEVDLDSAVSLQPLQNRRER